jgi:SAM-dependent methyltransferase
VERPGWFPDELPHAGPEHLDPSYVATYDRKAAFDPSADLVTLRTLGLNEFSVVVDFGAGTGTFALAVAPYCRRVVAVEVSPVMLGEIRAGIERSGLSNVEPIHAGLLSYGHHGDAPDFVYSRNTLHHLPDFWKAIALTRVNAMLRPGGVMLLHDLVYSFDPSDAASTLEAWFSRAVANPEEGYTGDELRTHVREEFSTFSWLLEPMLERAGFEIRQVTHRPSKTYSAYVCAKRS